MQGRNLPTAVYDSQLLQVLDELDPGRLTLPREPDTAPRVVTISAGREILSGVQTESRSCHDPHFLQPVHILARAAVSPALRPDFLLLTMHWSIMYDRAFDSFMAAAYRVLTAGYSLYGTRFTVADDGKHGLRDLIGMLAAPASTDPAWWQDSLSDFALASPWIARGIVDDQLRERQGRELLEWLSGLSAIKREHHSGGEMCRISRVKSRRFLLNSGPPTSSLIRKTMTVSSTRAQIDRLVMFVPMSDKYC